MKSKFFTKMSALLVAFALATSYSHAVTPLEAARTTFESHEIYIHEFASIGFSGLFPYSAYPPSATDAVEARLLIADQDLGDFFALTYNSTVGSNMNIYYQQYDQFALQFINFGLAGNATAMQQTANQWLQFAFAMANYLKSVNPGLPLSTAKTYFQQQISVDIAQVQAYINQDYASMISYYDQSRAVARAMAGFFFNTAP